MADNTPIAANRRNGLRRIVPLIVVLGLVGYGGYKLYSQRAAAKSGVLHGSGSIEATEDLRRHRYRGTHQSGAGRRRGQRQGRPGAGAVRRRDPAGAAAAGRGFAVRGPGATRPRPKPRRRPRRPTSTRSRRARGRRSSRPSSRQWSPRRAGSTTRRGPVGAGARRRCRPPQAARDQAVAAFRQPQAGRPSRADRGRCRRLPAGAGRGEASRRPTTTRSPAVPTLARCRSRWRCSKPPWRCRPPRATTKAS